MKFATKPIRTTHLTLGMLLHYLGKFNIQIFCTDCILVASNFVIHPHILIFDIKIASFS